MPRRRTSYAWALHTEASRTRGYQLSDTAQNGLAHARELAQADLWRKEQLLHQNELSAPLTIKQLAARDGSSEATIRRQIRAARYELFGEISDNAIYKRLQRHQQQNRRPQRPCQHPRCERHLPRGAHANRNYCATHSTGAARVHRHRNPAPKLPAALA